MHACINKHNACQYNVVYVFVLILERVLGPRERLLCSSLRSVVTTLSFLLRLPPLVRLVSQARMVPEEGTLMIKSVRLSSQSGCRHSVVRVF